ncbi:MAG TPA: hypothetical protein VLA13_01540 [Massilibacterium sp.]|nr:hypothetical protein [Massilibacterium sp.]
MKRKMRTPWIPFYILWGLVAMFLLILFYKIMVTPFEIDFPILLTFLLSLFSMVFMFYMYNRIERLINEIKLTIIEQERKVESQSLLSLEEDLQKKIISEEQTIRLKEEEQTMLIERIIQSGNTLSQNEKEQYKKRLQEINEEVAASKANVTSWKEKITDSLSLWFPSFEKTKQIKMIALKMNLDKEPSFNEMNERIQSIFGHLSKFERELLLEWDFIDENKQLTRVGYRELSKSLKS